MTTKNTKPTKQQKVSKSEAQKILGAFHKEAQKELDALDTVKEFATVEEVVDKDGTPTRVLEIDLDRVGVLGLFMDVGQPFSVQGNGDLQENPKKISQYMDFMANIDLSDDDNLKKIGWSAMSKARGMVRDFFILRLASDISEGQGTAK